MMDPFEILILVAKCESSMSTLQTKISLERGSGNVTLTIPPVYVRGVQDH